MQGAAVGEDDLQAQRGVGRRAVAARAVEQAVLRQRAADRGEAARDRPVVRRAHAVLGERLVQPLPGHARLDGHVPVARVDLADAVEPAGIDDQRGGARGRVALRVRHAAATGDDRQPGGRAPRARSRQLLRLAGATATCATA